MFGKERVNKEYLVFIIRKTLNIWNILINHCALYIKVHIRKIFVGKCPSHCVSIKGIIIIIQLSIPTLQIHKLYAVLLRQK